MRQLKRVNESDIDMYKHQDYAIQDVQADIETLLGIWDKLSKTSFREGNIRDIMRLMEHIIAYIISAYKIECSVGQRDDSDPKNTQRSAEMDYQKAQLEAEKLVTLLKGFSHTFRVVPDRRWADSKDLPIE